MAWNGSDQGKAKVEGQGQEKVERRGRGQEKGGQYQHSTRDTQRSTLRHGLLAGAIVVALGCAAVWWFVGRGGDNQLPTTNKPTTNRTIAEVKPDIATNRPAEVVEKPENPRELPPQRVGEVRNGYRLTPSGRLHRVKGVIEITPEPSEIEKTFPEPSDQLIAGLLTIEPGESMIGDSSLYFRDFNEKFAMSLKTPIEYDKDDPRQIKELKMAVQAARQELIERQKAGEDLAQVMAETRNAYQELGLYRSELQEMVRKSLDQKDDISADEYEDLVKAANKMLEERGSKPIDLPETFKHYLHVQFGEEDQQ